MRRLICFLTGHRMTNPSRWSLYSYKPARWFRDWNCGCCGKRLYTQSIDSDTDPNAWASPWSTQ